MTGFRLSDAQRLDWLRLIRSERIGPRTFRALVNQHGGAGAALDALPGIARKAGRGGLRIASRAEAEREVDGCAKLGATLVAQGEAEYPRALLAIDTAPPLIAIQGTPSVLQRPMVAMVGSRNASAAGGAFAERLAAELGQAGFTIVSGLARGIDTRAHRASVSTGTAAVLAGGLDRVYPDQNRPLVERILEEGGAIVSEMPLGWEPRGRDFPRRNRIVSGLAIGVVVVEAARRSGSLITARFALEQGREVFAVPGSPLDPRAEGTNDLIRSGATLCAQAEHVVAVLAPLVERGIVPGVETQRGYREPGPALQPDNGGLWDELEIGEQGSALELSFEEEPADLAPADMAPESERDRILALLSTSPISVDDLARQADLPVRRVHLVLVELDLARRIERHGGNAVSLVP